MSEGKRRKRGARVAYDGKITEISTASAGRQSLWSVGHAEASEVENMGNEYKKDL
jgi:hypothetical protein